MEEINVDITQTKTDEEAEWDKQAEIKIVKEVNKIYRLLVRVEKIANGLLPFSNDEIDDMIVACRDSIRAKAHFESLNVNDYY